MTKIIPIYRGTIYVGSEIKQERKLNLKNLKPLIDKLKLPNNYKKEISKKIKIEQSTG